MMMFRNIFENLSNDVKQIIDKPESENIVENAVIAGRINVSEFYSYARREFSVPDVVTSSGII